MMPSVLMPESRISTGSIRLFLLVLPFCLAACLGKTGTGKDQQTRIHGENIFFFSAVQGNPLCMFFSSNQKAKSELTGPVPTSWQADAWMVGPDISRHLCLKKGKDKRDPATPLFWKDDELWFNTDKDKFVFYHPLESGEVLLLSEPIFADRVLKSGDNEIYYGLMSSALFVGGQKIEGRIFCERSQFISAAKDAPLPPVTGLGPGGRAYLFWVPGGQFFYVAKKSLQEYGDRSDVALMQDRRGRWEETYQVRIDEPACVNTLSPCSESAEPFLFEVSLWDVTVSLESVPEVPSAKKATELADNEAAANASPGIAGVWDTLSTIPDKAEAAPLEFFVLRGTLKTQRETKAVYGLGVIVTQP